MTLGGIDQIVLRSRAKPLENFALGNLKKSPDAADNASLTYDMELPRSIDTPTH